MTHTANRDGGLRKALLGRAEELHDCLYLVLLDRLPVPDAIVIVNQLAQYFPGLRDIEILFQSDVVHNPGIKEHYRKFALRHIGAAKWSLVLGQFFWHLLLPDVLDDLRFCPGCRHLLVGQANVLKVDEFGQEKGISVPRRTRMSAEHIRFFRLEIDFATYRVTYPDGAVSIS